MSNKFDEIERYKKLSLAIANRVIKANPELYQVYKRVMVQQEELIEYEIPCHEYVDSDLLQKLGDTSRDSDHAIQSLITLAVVAQCLDTPRYKQSKMVESDRLRDIEKHILTLLHKRYGEEEES